MITISAETALVTGSSRGIGRGIALKLAESGVKKIGVHYLKNREAAENTASQLRDRGAEPLILQADVAKVDEILRMLSTLRESFETLDILVSNARPDVEHFYQPALEIPLDNWQTAIDSQARALLISVREAAGFMKGGGRIIAVT